ncbi:DUF3278 domain-containing protein [Lentilactobacillus sp. Marseille-Q4993]|uniref:DUF3278 domain-containing protein n=1 Tax=Lentilactobacillus sp. Marseille-Q4993 TaxID=3039492 RepID=UPI0024BD2283|nr:DUF3278 domain-containing protein [Lentilactobacillus sp. Marseille-Q4993]
MSKLGRFIFGIDGSLDEAQQERLMKAGMSSLVMIYILNYGLLAVSILIDWLTKHHNLSIYTFVIMAFIVVFTIYTEFKINQANVRNYEVYSEDEYHSRLKLELKRSLMWSLVTVILYFGMYFGLNLLFGDSMDLSFFVVGAPFLFVWWTLANYGGRKKKIVKVYE